jgi:hypothetical protein
MNNVLRTIHNFNNLLTYYDENLPHDIEQYIPATSSSIKDPLLIFLPEDLANLFTNYKQFKLGTYIFKMLGKWNCPHYGPYISIAECYYGAGSYATWNYYIKLDFYGKRIDDSPMNYSSINNQYHTFNELLSTYCSQIQKYDIKNGKIVSNVHSLSLN